MYAEVYFEDGEDGNLESILVEGDKSRLVDKSRISHLTTVRLPRLRIIILFHLRCENLLIIKRDVQETRLIKPLNTFRGTGCRNSDIDLPIIDVEKVIVNHFDAIRCLDYQLHLLVVHGDPGWVTSEEEERPGTFGFVISERGTGPELFPLSRVCMQN